MSKQLKHSLREFSKFLSGLIFCDLLVLIWFLFSDALPLTFINITLTDQMASVGIVFDVIILFLLIYFGWHQHKKSHKKKEHWFHYTAGTLFVIVALLHLARIFFGWSFVIGGWDAPYWLSVIGALITGFLAVVSFYLARD